MKSVTPYRDDTNKEKIFSICASYMRDWFNIPTSEWVLKNVDGTEKISRVVSEDSKQLSIPFDGQFEMRIDTKENTKILASYALAATLMAEKLQGKVNPSDDYVSAIGFRAAVTAMQQNTGLTVPQGDI